MTKLYDTKHAADVIVAIIVVLTGHKGSCMR